MTAVTSVVRDGMLCFEGHGRRVIVCDTVLGVWRKHRQTRPYATESFGVLMGTTSVNGRKIWIEAVTTPMALDQCSRSFFALRDPGHRREVCRRFSRSAGRSIYLGTWHTHAEPTPAPSLVDRRDWSACQRANRGRPMAFVLVGTRQVCVFVRARWRFNALSEVNDDRS